MSWGSLQALLVEARTYRPRAGTECPNDGTPLLPWRGQLRCPFDGWTGHATQAVPAPAAADNSIEYTASYETTY